MSRPIKCRLLILAAVLAAAIAAAANTGVIKKVLSGDIVQVGDAFIARLTGLRAPRLGEPLGREVYEFTLKELEGKLVQLATWTTDNTAAGIVYDEQGFPFVLIRYGPLSRDKGSETCFNEVLLKKGYARVDPKYLPDDLRHYLDLEKEARGKGLGIWKGQVAPSGH
ncbi:MAG TPA: thermonuclease family protein [Acidobacteriota bacterium]|nr:thermonuclease family protein [Acidobacteriota bacterium]